MWNNSWQRTGMKKILVVDDEADIGLLMKAMLKNAGYDVTHAANLGDAVYLLKHNTYDTIFLDLNLDHEFGLNLVPTIREENNNAHVVVISAQKAPDVKEQVAAEGIRLFIEKPFNKSQILKALE